MKRLEVDEYFLRMAELVSTRSTCIRRSVGCVLVNNRKHVLATGYNGVSAGAPHCNEEIECADGILKYPHACPGSKAESGTKLDDCYAIHAEQNALLQCRDVWDIQTVYLTTTPCITCVKLLMNTSAMRIVACEEYDSTSKNLWLERARRISIVYGKGWGFVKQAWTLIPKNY